MSYDTTIARLPQPALLDLKGPPRVLAGKLAALGLAMPAAPNSASAAEDLELYWIGPEHWLLRGPADAEPRLLRALAPEETFSAVIVSDAYTLFAVTGADAGEIAAIASPLDRHPGAFPPNGVSFTEAFGLKALLIDREDGFELAVERSFADMTADYLDRVAGGAGISALKEP